MNQFKWLIISVIVLFGFSFSITYGQSFWVPMFHKVKGIHTVDDVIVEYGASARERLTAHFIAAGENYPPRSVTFLAIKDIGSLEVWVGSELAPTYIHTYPILAHSGVAGPKLREGDHQVPEGIYDIEGLNPNSSYHLSLKLNYPNQFDLTHAQADGRDFPGTNIFIHGKSVSVGCLAMGDPAIEDLFVLVADVGRSNVEVVISPSDPRMTQLTPSASLPWTAELYDSITAKFAHYSRLPSTQRE